MNPNVTGSAFMVLAAGRELRATLDDPPGRADAAERLAIVLERDLAAPLPEHSLFEWSAVPPGLQEPSPGGATETDVRRLLDAAATRLRVAEVALAAGEAVGETAAGDRPSTGEGLDHALTGLRDTATSLADREEADATRHFESAVVTSPDLPTAAATLRTTVAETLDSITKQTSVALASPFRAAAGLAPEAARKAWESVTERLQIGDLGGRLTRLGIRAVLSAIDALGRLVPGQWLVTARVKLVELRDRLEAHGGTDAAVGWLLGVEGLRAEADAIAASPGLEIARLDTASLDLTALTARYTSAMDVIGLIQAGIAGLGLIKLVGLAVPHLTAVLVGAELLVGAVVIVLALDYVDSTVAPSWVRGARTIIQEASRGA
ncbi:hypothetical protein [Phytohabitans aurantiacus]|jgi:hypothetical protein|uniref:Uncharacterized protein n=1 Tax=Phytohabitans aurantiacus TaxID=3016789 RepID=A0ABQ5R198_9ACTN|nr:hypothetical protein [Phytohabitans aurantiacus]GLI00496.1 hypothetical protein Pa4123_57720 [Phytohabitans aurantiacus]